MDVIVSDEIQNLINGYDGNETHVRRNAEYVQGLFRKYCQSDGGMYTIYK